jgi:26S proteasome regulatory subunit N2
MSSARGILALLDDEDTRVRAKALELLYPLVDTYWAEIAEKVETIEALSEMEDFSHTELAAAVASKCFYHLEDYDIALSLALSAGSHFDINAESQYIETMLARGVDEYIQRRVEDDGDVDLRLTRIVERMFERCFTDGSYKQALGIALEARRLDIVESAIKNSPDVADMLRYVFNVTQSTVSKRAFRQEVLRVVVKLHRAQAECDYVSLCQCLQALDDAQEVAEIMKILLASDNEGFHLMAYQVGFDLCENENQEYLLNVETCLPRSPLERKMAKEAEKNGEGDGADKEESGAAPDPSDGLPTDDADPVWGRFKQMRAILVDGVSVDLYLDFLYRNNKADLLLLKKIKDGLPERNSVLHGAAVTCHGYMHCGTTVDLFLRKNLEWLGKAKLWAKFSAIASMGVVHKGHLGESMNLLKPYLPQGGMTTAPYQEGGALYALGLIHANKGGRGDGQVTSFLKDAIETSNANADEKAREVVQHGASLGLGLAAMATGDEALYALLRNTMYNDSAVAGEASAIAIGLIMLGKANENAITELLQYAHETKHEKIIRGVALCIALNMFGREDTADALIETLSRDKDAILRSGAMWTIAMAYAGTTNNSAIRRLLHVAVSDANDDVRRTAVMALGFVMFRSPEEVPELVSLLSESYNPHVRYGSCMAVGIACAGKPSKAALDLLAPMLEDPVDFVRQGALLSMSLMLMQENDAKSKEAKTLREKVMKILTDPTYSKHQPTMAKFGALIAAGILDAGGRNMCVALSSRSGFLRMGAVVGLCVWCHHWYWHPLLHFFSLTLTPTAVIGVNKELKIPGSFKIKCNAKPSLFAYPEPLKEVVEEKKERVTTAILSITSKAKAKEAKKKKDDGVEMEVDPSQEPGSPKADATEATESAQKDEEKSVKVPEPDSFELNNPCRVTYSQQSCMSFILDQRYRPVRKGLSAQSNLGVLVLTDSSPGEDDDDLRDIKAPPMIGDDGPEPDPPEPFEWIPPEFRS